MNLLFLLLLPTVPPTPEPAGEGEAPAPEDEGEAPDGATEADEGPGLG